MSPVEIECCLHYYYATDDWTNHGRPDAPIVGELIDNFIGLGLLNECPVGSKNEYEATGRLRAYVEYLKAVPLPILVSTWEMPKETT